MKSVVRTKTFLMLMIIFSLRNCQALDEVKKLSNDGNHTHRNPDKGIQFKKRLRIGVPFFSGFPELLNVQFDFQSNKTNASGFIIDVFKAAIESLPYEVHYEFIAYLNSSGHYNDLVHQVYLQKYDAVVGDVTITANRSLYVDFTLPFTDLGIGMIGLKQNEKSKWIFLKPLTADLWLASAGLFLFTGFVVWIIERSRNDEFQGPPSQQIGTAFWFSFSTLVFAHREKLLSNLSRFVVIIWVFVVLVLSSSYTATLTSMLTVQQIELNSKNIHLGYQYGSFSTNESISNLNFQNSRLQPFKSLEDYAEALSKGSKNGGVSAILDEMPYIKLFLAKHGKRYSMIGPVLPTTNGFGFVFPKGSRLVQGMSRAIAKLREEEKLLKMENAMLNTQIDVTFGDYTANTIPLTLDRFQGLFLISGGSSILALTIFSMFVLRSKFKFIKRYLSRNMILTRSIGESNVVAPT